MAGIEPNRENGGSEGESGRRAKVRREGLTWLGRSVKQAGSESRPHHGRNGAVGIGYSKILPRLKRQIAMDITTAVMPPRMPRSGRIWRKLWPAQSTALKPSIDQ